MLLTKLWLWYWLRALPALAGYLKIHCFHTFTLSSGRLTTLSLRNFVGMKPATPLSRRVFTPMAWPGQEPLSKWFQTLSEAKVKVIQHGNKIASAAHTQTSLKAVSANWCSQQRHVEGQGTEDFYECYPVMQSSYFSPAQLMGLCNQEGQNIFRCGTQACS